MESPNNNMKKILDATILLLKKTPYDSITIKDICKEADVSRQTFYNYFKSKDEIFKEFFNYATRESKIFSTDNPPEYFFSEQYLLDIINFYDEYSDIFISLYNQNILWYLSKDLISNHKNTVFANIQDRFILEHSNYYYLYTTLTVSYICIEWIKGGKKESKEELIHMMKYFSEFKI